MFQVHHHHIVPKSQALEIAHQIVVDHGEFARQVGFDREVAKARLNGRVHANDVGNGGRGRNRHTVGVAHAVSGNLLAQAIPVQC